MKKYKYGNKYGNKHGKTIIICFSLLTSLFYNCTVHAGQPIASINGRACNFNTIADAIAAAQPNDTINIKGGTHQQLIGEIPISLTLVASRGATGTAGCEFGSNAFAIIDGLGQTFDTTGGLVKITNGAKATFRNMALTNASAINGGIMAVIDGSSVTLDNVDIYAGSALTAGGNVYVSAGTAVQSALNMDKGSTIYNGTVITGDGGGLALYGSNLLINDGSIGLLGINQGNSVSNNGGGIYAENSTIVINNFDSHIQNNQADNFGGGIYTVGSTMTITNATVNDNTTDFSGGGIYLDSTNLNLIDATINNNMTTVNIANAGGGGLYLTRFSQAIVDLSTISSNSSENLGGGILSRDSFSTVDLINGSDIINNSSRLGGGIFTQSPLSLDSSLIRFNSSSSDGGGIYCGECQSLSIINSSQISNNTATNAGGGIRIFTTSNTFVELRNSSFTGNSGTSLGGGVRQNGGTILIDSCTFSSNNADVYGGAVSLRDFDNVQDSVRIINSQFFNNSTSSTDENTGGGALYLYGIFDAHIIGSSFNDNSSTRDGGAIIAFDSNLTIDETIIADNIAIFEGGGIHAVDSDLTIRNSTIISENDAGSEGGGIRVENSDLMISDSLINQNLAFAGGGINALNSTLDAINSKINHNTSFTNGGGINFVGGSDNSLSVKSLYGNSSSECLPSSLNFNVYCSEISNNTAKAGAGLMITGSTNEQGITLSSVSLNSNIVTIGGLIVSSGVALHIDITNPIDTDVTLENIMVVETDGVFEGNAMIFAQGNITLDLLSSTIANNSGKPIYAEDSNSTIIVQSSILQQNTSGPHVVNNVPFISLCNNSQAAFIGGQSFGANLGDPQFITTSRGDYRLSETSPSLDSCSFGTLVDIDGNVRPNDNGNYDQGAFEMNADFVVDEIFTDGFEL